MSKKKIKTYHEREWLTKKGDSATPTVVSFAGETIWGNGETEPFYMLEIASCHDKVRLHRTQEQTKEEWLGQLETLHKHIGDYISFLKTGVYK